MNLQETLQNSPIIAAVKDREGMRAALECDSQIFFVLFGTICDIDEIVGEIKSAGKTVFVHLDLVEGLAGKDVAVDFLQKVASPDGIISTKPSLLKYAKSRGLLTVQRFFLLDSLAEANIDRQFAVSRPDMVEILPGLMTLLDRGDRAQTPRNPGDCRRADPHQRRGARRAESRRRRGLLHQPERLVHVSYSCRILLLTA